MSVLYSVQPETFKLIVDRKDGISHNGSFEKKHMDLLACRNSYGAFQILLQGTQRICVCLNDDPWFSEYPDAQVVYLRHKGALRPRVNHIAIHTGDDEREYADRIMRDVVTTTVAGVPQSVFVRFDVPADMQPGTYEGEFELISAHLFDEEQVIGSITYTLEVSEFTLPAKKDQKFEMDLWQLHCTISKYIGIPNWSEEHFALIDEYLKPLAEMGQTNITVIASQIPWSGQRCFLEPVKANMFQYSMIPVEKTENGFVYDYSIMDRYIEMCFRYGIDRKIEVFGLIGNWNSPEHGYGNFTEMPDAIRVRYKDTDGRYRYMQKAEDLKHYIRSLQDHFVEKGWIDKVRVIADEPWYYDVLRNTLEVIHEIAPLFKFKACFYEKKFFDAFQDIISDFCIVFHGLPLALEEWKRLYREDKDHCFTCYVCCNPDLPNMFLRSDLMETLYLPAAAQYFGMEGFLRWNYTIWPADPRRDIRYPKWAAGDTNMVYPALDGKPELTLRYYALRRGIENYEILRQLEEKGLNEIREKLLTKVVADPDVTHFYDAEGRTIVTFNQISTATQEDYDIFRKEALVALA
ncbi:MAG: DUF4091 domain-containing protein [Oscillospiraceae bacterium]|nr:DUF4091 domain-containing protein [Oscillospiraceae bacterium]